jgi:hypothetical protein
VNGKSNMYANAVAILDECNLRSDEVQVETRCNLCDKTIDDENYDFYSVDLLIWLIWIPHHDF